MGRERYFLFLNSLGIIHRLTAVLVTWVGASLQNKPWQSTQHPIWLHCICALAVSLLCNLWASTHSLLTFIYSFDFIFTSSNRCHFQVTKGGWEHVDTRLGLMSMLREQMGKALHSSRKRGYLRTSSLCVEALLEERIRSGNWFHETGRNRHFVLFLQNKIPVYVGGKRQELCSVQYKQPKCSEYLKQ